MQPAKMPPQMTVLARGSMPSMMSPDLRDAAIGQQGNFLFGGDAGADVERGHLGNADTRDDAGGADRAGALADFDGAGTAIGEVFDAGGTGDIAGDDGQFRGRRRATP